MACIEKHPICFQIRCFLRLFVIFMVEISGIEPLTS